MVDIGDGGDSDADCLDISMSLDLKCSEGFAEMEGSGEEEGNGEFLHISFKYRVM